MTPKRSTLTHVDPRWREMLYFVLLVPPALVLSDIWLMSFQTSSRQPLWSLAVYLWFCIQCATVSYYAGRKLRNSRWWFGILAWTILLIDIHVCAMATPLHYWMNHTRMLGYAFASGQAGIAVVWSLLSLGTWRIRTPLLVGGILWAVTLGLGMHHQAMMLLLIGQTVATLAFCLAMRAAGFRIAHVVDPTSKLNSEGKTTVQFSIRHLFFYTTLVGLVVGVARWIDWASLFIHVQLRELPFVLWIAVALTVVSMIATWAALGRESWLIRIPVGILLLPMVGLAIGYWHPPTSVGSWGYEMSAGLFSSGARMLSWGIWTTLAGLFLAGILLVFRADGRRLVRVD